MPRYGDEPEYVTLDGYEVGHTTELAVGLAKAGENELSWVPRSVCQDGNSIEKGDTDIVVARWFAAKAELAY